MRKWHLYLIAMIVIISACSKNVYKKDQSPSIIGQWEWLKSEGGLANHIHDTPLSTGKKIELKINTDHKYYIFTNGRLTSQGTYSLETRRCIHEQKEKVFIDFSSDQDMVIERLSQDRLELSDEAYDGIGSVYQRILADDHSLQ